MWWRGWQEYRKNRPTKKDEDPDRRDEIFLFWEIVKYFPGGWEGRCQRKTNNSSSVLEWEEDWSLTVLSYHGISTAHFPIPPHGQARLCDTSYPGCSPHNYKFKHSIIAIVSRSSSLSIFLMASQRDNNSKPTFHTKRRVTWENWAHWLPQLWVRARTDWLTAAHHHPAHREQNCGGPADSRQAVPVFCVLQGPEYNRLMTRRARPGHGEIMDNLRNLRRQFSILIFQHSASASW